MIRFRLALAVILTGLPACSTPNPTLTNTVDRSISTIRESDQLTWIQLWQQMQSPGVSKHPETMTCKAAQALMNETAFPLSAYAKSKYEIECQNVSNVTASDDGLWRLEVFSRFALQTPPLTDDLTYYELQERFSPVTQEREDALLKLVSINRQLKNEEKAKEWEEKLWQKSPRLQPGIEETLNKGSPLPSPMWPLIAKDFRDHLDYGKAIQFYRKALADKSISFDVAWELHKQLRQTYKLSYHKKTQMLSSSRIWSRWTERALRENPTQLWVDRYLETQLTHARGLWTENRQQESVQVLRHTKTFLTTLTSQPNTKLKQNNSLHFSLAEIDFIFARIQEQDHHYDRAVAAYDSALQNNPESKLQEKIMWAKAWLLFRREKYSEAATALNDLVQTFKKSPNSSNKTPPENQAPPNQAQKWRALYWQARAKEKIKPGSGNDLYLELIQDDHLGYYGLMAERDLNHLLPPLGSSQVQTTSSEKPVPANDLTETVSPEAKTLNFTLFKKLGVSTDILSALDWSLLLQEKTLIKICILRLEQALGPLSHQSAEAQLEFLKAQAVSGLYLPLFTKISALETSDRQKLLSQSPQLVFPQIRPELVAQITRNYQYSPSLVYAITRQESAFDPLARSGADALGLMQLLPSIAKPSARALGLPFKDPLDLFDPEFNLKVGAQELHRLLVTWHDQYIPAIASYNAGEKVVRGWMKKKNRRDPLEFIEEIPYEETRNYVKLVIRNYTFYERLRKTEPVLFDEKLLKLTSPRRK